MFVCQFIVVYVCLPVHLLLSERKQASQNVAFSSCDWGLTAIRLCSTETQAILSDFRHFQAGSVDFELIVVKLCVWSTFKSDARYSETFEGDLRSLPFQKSNAEKCNVMLRAKLLGRPLSPLNPSQFNKHS